ncbi:hypothetical protein FOA43_002030 [Brettanomyces nanus]|uniref:Large ribosomal subunit protein uL3m n=1 Tax=Eeniella nana TaxID=13502 RepID=A0A875RUL3_EENNA|nr:uncharacterized protein FOA43_002030 [Brettanomyces nanus]QPG74697.1 hypothetical protein FOA43_002030 [Brettanomyces nanus]
MFPFSEKLPVEKNIWQIWRTSNISETDFPESCVPLVERWKDANKEYEHHVLSLEDAENMVKSELGAISEITEALRLMPDDRVRLEFLKYLVIYIKGGVYADIDTINIKPIKHWKLMNETSLVTGIMSDYNHIGWYNFFNRRMVLSNSIFVAKAHHPMLAQLIARITCICITQQKLITATNWTRVLGAYDINGDPVVQFTGPSIFTDVFFDWISANMGEDEVVEMDEDDRMRLEDSEIIGPEGAKFSYRNVTGISHGVKVGNTAILPQISFNGFENSYEEVIDDQERSTGYERFSAAQLVSPGAIPYVETEDTVKQRSPEARRLRRQLLGRPGVIGVKRGMTCFYDNQGRRMPATVIEVDQCEVVYNKTLEKHGYYAVQVGCGYKKPENQTKPMLGHFAQAKVSPKAAVSEFMVKDKAGLIKPGTELRADMFKPGQFVDVISTCKGKGFAGAMKKWGYHGGPATHGASLSHRSMGSIGQNTTPSRVFPGKKMPGRMGNHEHTIFNLQVLDVNGEKGYMLVKGGVSGSNGSFVRVRDAFKHL